MLPAHPLALGLRISANLEGRKKGENRKEQQEDIEEGKGRELLEWHSIV